MKSKNIYIVALITGAAGFTFVYDSANLGGSIKYLKGYFNLTPSEVGLIVAISLLGNIFGSLFSAYLTDKLGRKSSMIRGTLIGIIGLILTMLSINVYMFALGRVIFGLSVGLVFVAAPMYISEVAPASKRGRAGSMRQLLLALGLVVGYTAVYIFESLFSLEWNTMLGWRFLIGIEIILLTSTLLLFLTLYESPRWLMLKRKDSEAKMILSEFIPSADRVQLVYSEMVKNREKSPANNKIQIKGGLIYALLICLIFPIFRQLSGVNAITYYAQRIFNEISDGGSSLAYFQSIFIGASDFLGAIFVVIFADKLGRKVILLIGATGMFLSEALISYFLYLDEVSIYASYLIYTYGFFYTISAGALLTVYISEVVPTIVRSKGTSLAGVINWIFDAIVIYSFPLLNANIYLTERFHGAVPFMIYATAMILFFIVILFLPETKGKTLEEIAEYWRKKGDWEK